MGKFVTLSLTGQKDLNGDPLQVYLAFDSIVVVRPVFGDPAPATPAVAIVYDPKTGKPIDPNTGKEPAPAKAVPIGSVVEYEAGRTEGCLNVDETPDQVVSGSGAPAKSKTVESVPVSGSNTTESA
jgi:hypothetical protein